MTAVQQFLPQSAAKSLGHNAGQDILSPSRLPVSPPERVGFPLTMWLRVVRRVRGICHNLQQFLQQSSRRTHRRGKDSTSFPTQRNGERT